MNVPDDLPDDEVVSAVLDGAATEATRRSVAADPVLAARLAVFGALRDEMRDVAASDDLLDQLRTAAVASFAGEPPVKRAAQRRPRLATRQWATRQWVAAAAAAVVLVAGIGLFTSRGPGGSSAEDASRSSTAGPATAAFTERATADLAGTGATGAGTLPTAKAAGVPESAPANLGAVASLDALAATYRAQVTRNGAAKATQATQATGATQAAGAPPTTGCSTPVAEAFLGDTLVRLELRGDRVDVVEAATCKLIGSFTP